MHRLTNMYSSSITRNCFIACAFRQSDQCFCCPHEASTEPWLCIKQTFMTLTRLCLHCWDDPEDRFKFETTRIIVFHKNINEDLGCCSLSCRNFLRTLVYEDRFIFHAFLVFILSYAFRLSAQKPLLYE